MDSILRKKGAWFGLVLGDVLGAPYEFCPASGLEHLTAPLDLTAGGGWDLGEWTDDTALMLATSEAYRDGKFEPGHAATAMADWLATDPKDVGILTRRSLNHIIEGRATYETAGALALREQPGAAGNGSLMRCLPTALVRHPDDQRLVVETEILSRITHADERCVAACVAYNVLVSSIVMGCDFAEAIGRARACANHDDVRGIVQRVGNGEQARYRDEQGIGFVLLALERALLAFRDATDFEGALTGTVKRGGDTDTNAAIAGGVLGARFGFDALPKRWLGDLRRYDLIEARFLELLANG